MDTQKLAQNVFQVGVTLTALAIAWWAWFYYQIAQGVGGRLMDALSCLYSTGGPCGFVSGFASLGGYTPYSPIIFWLGLATLGAGIVLRLSLKSGTSGPKQDSTQRCPFCAESIRTDATVCKNCGKDLPDETVILPENVKCPNCKTFLYSEWSRETRPALFLSRVFLAV